MAILPATEKREGKSWRWASEVSDMVLERGGVAIWWDFSVLMRGYGTAITDVEGVGVQALCTKVVVVVARDNRRAWVATPARIGGHSARPTGLTVPRPPDGLVTEVRPPAWMMMAGRED